MMEEQDPNSILDTDLYKLTMHYVVWSIYPTVHVNYGFINRSKSTQPFTRSAYGVLSKKVECLKTRRLTLEEKDWLGIHCAYLPGKYLDYLESYRFQPDQQLEIQFHPFQSTTDFHTCKEEYGDLQIRIKGLWVDTILYEVPLLSLISEAYFETVDQEWNYDSQVERAKSKANQLFSSGCKFSEFGTRRRRSWKTQLMVTDGIQQAAATNEHYNFTTSNVWMARRFQIKPVGTMAHEMIMAEGALNGYQSVHMRILDNWEKCFPNNPELWIALTDTFSTGPFFREMVNNPDQAKRWLGLRQDSGDPKEFALNALKAWNSIGIDPKTKLVIFSDGLDVETCCQLRKFCETEGLIESYGIGTHFTNDFYKNDATDYCQNRTKSKPLNIVIKLLTVNGLPCVKLSDVIEKAIGPQEEIDKIKSILKI